MEEMRRYSGINSEQDLLQALDELCDQVSHFDNVIECVQLHRKSDGTEATVLVTTLDFEHKCGAGMSLSLMKSFHSTGITLDCM